MVTHVLTNRLAMLCGADVSGTLAWDVCSWTLRHNTTCPVCALYVTVLAANEVDDSEHDLRELAERILEADLPARHE